MLEGRKSDSGVVEGAGGVVGPRTALPGCPSALPGAAARPDECLPGRSARPWPVELEAPALRVAAEVDSPFEVVSSMAIMQHLTLVGS